MGRGRQKAKNTKVARELKYYSPSTDYSALEAELGQKAGQQNEDFVDRWWVFHVLLLAIASYLLLNGYLLWHRGQTLGKALLGIAVIRTPADLTGLPDGTFEFVPATFWKLVCIRALFFPLLFVGIVPYFTILPLLDQLFIFGRQRRCLHDWISGTLVIRVS